MNAKENMIIIKNEIKTNQVERCQYNPSTEKMQVKFSNGKRYPYNANNVKCLKNPAILDGNSYRISRAGKVFYGIVEIYIFKDGNSSYWHICFNNGTERDYKEDKYASLDVLCHFPMNMLIRDTKMLDEKESSYAMHLATHIDFLIYSMVSKKPVLAVEVDGYTYHKTGTAQASRDQLKNHILKLYEIPFLRLRTNGSGEKEKIIEILDTLVR